MASSQLDPYPGYYPPEYHTKTNTLWYRPAIICPTCQEPMDKIHGHYHCGNCCMSGHYEPVLCPNCLDLMPFNVDGFHECKSCGLIDPYEPKKRLPPQAPKPGVDRKRLRALKRFGSLKREMRVG